MTQQEAAAAQGYEPFVVLTYGPSGIGKTTDMGYSFPTALFVAAPGALNSIESVCGYRPDRVEVETIEAAKNLVVEVGKSKRYETIVFDDFSFLAEQTFSALERKYTGFKLWGVLRDHTLDFRNQSRYAGVNVLLNAWEQGPKVKPDGTRVRGGPQLSGKLPEQIPAMCDLVLRAMHEPGRQPWPAVYRCNSDPSYVMKDRFNIATVADPAPMNIAELLRASGRHVPRHPALGDAQEQQVETIARELGDTPNDGEKINMFFRALVESGVSPVAARWTLRDAIDRAVIRVAQKVSYLTFFDTTASTFLG
jgi:hypothetical protein